MLLEAVTLFGMIKEQAKPLNHRLDIRVAQMLAKTDSANMSSRIFMRCQNGISLTWERAIENFASDMYSESPLPGGITYNQVIECVDAFLATDALPITQLIKILGKEKLSPVTLSNHLLHYFPVLLVSTLDIAVAVNLQELVLQPTTLADLLKLDEEMAANSKEQPKQGDAQAQGDQQ